jgi:glycerol-3-phosphate dehydrogenase
MPKADFDAFLADLMARKPFLDASTARRLAKAYGTRVDAFLGEARRPTDLGRDFGAGLSEAEIDYLMEAEWARSVEDILWRRSKLGLHLPQAAVADIGRYLETPRGTRTAATKNA